MLDDDERMADGEEGLEAIQEGDDVGEVEAGGGFVEDEEGAVLGGG